MFWPHGSGTATTCAVGASGISQRKLDKEVGGQHPGCTRNVYIMICMMIV